MTEQTNDHAHDVVEVPMVEGLFGPSVAFARASHQNGVVERRGNGSSRTARWGFSAMDAQR